MNTTVKRGLDLALAIKRGVKNIKNVEVVICPPFISLDRISSRLGNNLKLGAQNCFWEEKGPYTGEISAAMLKSICHYVILGHSERRQYLVEKNQDIAKKVKAALESDLIPIICLGETKVQKQKGQTKRVVLNQLKKALSLINKRDINKVIIVYEPVWAISSVSKGKIENPKETSKVAELIKGFLVRNYGRKTKNYVRIIYGGSVNSRNIKSIIRDSGTDGVLVGQASLDSQEFIKIIKAYVR